MVHLDRINHIRSVLSDYNNKPFVYGERDCNLLILDLYEPEISGKIKNKYSTLRGGLKLSKKVIGTYSLKGYLEEHYTEIHPSCVMDGDIVYANKKFTFMLNMGDRYFGITQDVFNFIPKTRFDQTNYKFYRRAYHA